MVAEFDIRRKEMIIEKGSKVHIMYRALFENSVRRHIIGEVMFATGALCRVEGFAFVRDPQSGMYQKKPELRTTIVDLAESGYIVNIINSEVNLSEVSYSYVENIGLVATDGKGFSLDINEFGTRN